MSCEYNPDATGDCCFPTNEPPPGSTNRCYNMWTKLNVPSVINIKSTCDSFNSDFFTPSGGGLVNKDSKSCLHYRLTGGLGGDKSWTCTDTRDLEYCNEVINKCTNEGQDVPNLHNWHDCCSKGSEVSCVDLKQLTSMDVDDVDYLTVCPLLARCDKYQPTDCTYDQCPANLSECKEAISQCEQYFQLPSQQSSPTSMPKLKQFYDCCSSVTLPPSPVSGSTPTWVMPLAIGVAVIIVAICIIFAFRRNQKTRSSLDKIIDAM